MKKMQKWAEGDVVVIGIGQRKFVYARVLGDASIAVYDQLCDARVELDDIERLPILFAVPVMSNAITSGRWSVIGNRQLCGALATPPVYFAQDILNPDSITIWTGGCERTATLAEVEGLECYAVWDAEQVEQRIRDHYAGVPNVWAEQLKAKSR